MIVSFDSRWKQLFEFLCSVTHAGSVENGLEEVMSILDELVPADRGVSLMRMDGLIPFCIRWPSYAESLVPRFNGYFNRRSPIYYTPPYHDLPPVDWRRYAGSEYDEEFNRPLEIRHSIGVGFRDGPRRMQYAVFVHRSPSERPFDETDRWVLRRLSRPLTEVLSLISQKRPGFSDAIHQRETEEGCKVLSPREAEVADLICRRMTMKTIAERLGISPRTVERHALHIYDKLDIRGREELIRLGTTNGMVATHCESEDDEA